MKLRYLFLLAWVAGLTTVITGVSVAGPYAPAAGQVGSTAIAASDPLFVAWASGFENIILGPGTSADPNPYTGETYTPDLTLGPSDATGGVHPVYPLGQGGEITLTFNAPIMDGEGFDFAVFENSFSDGFLELAFVEVSSNGIDFFRFPGISLTPTAINGFFGIVDPTDVTNLAGKYRAAYGTPFDLSELSGVSASLNIHAITHVRIIDILGDGNTLDSLSNPIYDPYPTSGTAGFDLDAVGVIHQMITFEQKMMTQVTDPGKRSATDDADGDGRSNLLEYMLGSHAGVKDHGPEAGLDLTEPAAPAFKFQLDTAASGATVEVRWSSNLSGSDWTPIARKPSGSAWQSLVSNVSATQSAAGEVEVSDQRSHSSGFYQLHVY